MARMQGKTTSDDYQYFAGVDVSKAHLDLRVAGTRHGQRFPSTEGGIADLVKVPGQPHLVVFEPTGRYHPALWQALAAAGHGAAPCHPYQARHLATGLGKLAKTDRIDALVLCTIAERHPPEVTPAPTDFELEIKELYAALRSAIKHRAMIRTQTTASFSARVKQSLAAREACLATEIKALTVALTTLFKANPATRRIREILVSIPGIGEGAAAAILALLPEIGHTTKAEIAARTGTAPMTQESGQWRGRARAKGGRRSLRTVLHMPAIVAMTRNPDLKTFADRLRAKGKHTCAVITAFVGKTVPRTVF